MSGTMCRRFHGAPIVRLIVTVPADKVAEIDRLIGGEHLAHGCRAEFVRLAIAEKLERDLMICEPPKREPRRRIADPVKAGGLQ